MLRNTGYKQSGIELATYGGRVAVACSVRVSVPLAGMCVARVGVCKGGGRGEGVRVDEGE